MSQHANLTRTALIQDYNGRYQITCTGVITDLWKQRTIRVSKSGNGYLYCTLAVPGETDGVPVKRKSLALHRLLAEAFLPRLIGADQVDHVDQDKLNNSLGNLKWVTRQEQMRNRKAWGNSRFKGVSRVGNGEKWRASIVINGELILLGEYTSETAAALAWNVAAKRNGYRPALLNRP